MLMCALKFRTPFAEHVAQLLSRESDQRYHNVSQKGNEIHQKVDSLGLIKVQLSQICIGLDYIISKFYACPRENVSQSLTSLQRGQIMALHSA